MMTSEIGHQPDDPPVPKLVFKQEFVRRILGESKRLPRLKLWMEVTVKQTYAHYTTAEFDVTGL